MIKVQYTIRAIPKNLDDFLRRQAKLRGKSLNQTVLDYIQQATKLDLEQTNETFDWIIGANTIDSASAQAIAKLKTTDKLKSKV